MTAAAALLDHVVVNTLRGMDAAARTFAGLGFALTPRGHHSLGSINHLMMTRGAYLELVGVPEAGLQRQEVLESPFGLNGLVMRSDDAERTYDRLRAAGFPAAPPSTFFRPVTIDGAEHDACFRTVRLPNDVFPAGRVYFCEHLTPDYVWRDEWLTHPNGFQAIDEMVVASAHPAPEAQRYAEACGAVAAREDDGWSVRLDSFAIRLVPRHEPRFLSLGLRFASLEVLRDRALASSDVRWEPIDADTGTLHVPAFALRLDCRKVA